MPRLARGRGSPVPRRASIQPCSRDEGAGGTAGVLARLDGTEFSPEISRRNLPAVRKLLRLG